MTRTTIVFALCGLAAAASASVQYDQNVTPDVIFGAGNANGSYTTQRVGDLEIGLRGKLRFNSLNQAENTFNSNGDGTYTFDNILPPTGFGFAPGSPQTAIWNFEWSVNTNYTGSGSNNLDHYTYEIGIDADPGIGTNFLTFDPITAGAFQPFWDHSIGNNATGNGLGAEAANAGAYTALLAGNNVAQNSWNYEFFKSLAPLTTFDPTDVGVYDIYFAVIEGGTEVGRSTIQIVTPAPASAALMGLAGLAASRRRRG